MNYINKYKSNLNFTIHVFTKKKKQILSNTTKNHNKSQNMSQNPQSTINN